MKVIYKYNVNIGQTTLKLPKGAKVLSFQAQDDELFIWALVDKKQEVEDRVFILVGTGQEFNTTYLAYIGTTQSGMFVWHLFEAIL